MQPSELFEMPAPVAPSAVATESATATETATAVLEPESVESAEVDWFADVPPAPGRMATEAWEFGGVEPVQGLPARLIEFPQPLVATRKSRPRRAEAQLDEAQELQLSIFEVDPGILRNVEQVTAAAVAEPVAEPEWAWVEQESEPTATWAEMEAEAAVADAPVAKEVAVWIEAEPAVEASVATWVEPAPEVLPEPMPQRLPDVVVEADPNARAVPPVDMASAMRRLLAVVMDMTLIGGALSGAVWAAASRMESYPTMREFGIGIAVAFVAGTVAYQLLFGLAGLATPGMRYAHIAACTLEGLRPTRRQMQARTWGLLVSVLPMGLGILWGMFDKRHLGWHDKMSGTYLRKRLI